MHKPFLFLALLISCSITVAQNFPVKNYPRGYFTYPVEAPLGLAANFGELRPNHYHMGLDCKTERRENLPVYAAADGYIAKVKIEPFGFGRAIYINHPNGLTTLYAHLNNFTPELEAYIKQQQYLLQSWKVFIDIPAVMFPVKQKQMIAYSGNTGGSQGPHLHFEIRDTKTDKVLNPLLFKFAINDNIPPVITRLAIYDRCISTYDQSPKIIAVKKAAGIYQPANPVININSERISFGISATDQVSGSPNPNGIFEAFIYDNGRLISGFQLDNISYAETRYLNAHIDYKTKAAGGPYIEHLSRLPGYPEGVYKDFAGDGIIALDDTSIHQIKIIVNDAYGNSSALEFKIKRTGLSKIPTKTIAPEAVMFHPGYVNIFENDLIQIVTTEKTLYDSVLFIHSQKNSAYPNSVSPLHAVLSGLVPAHDSFTIKIKAIGLNEVLHNKILIKWTWKNKSEVTKPVQEEDWYAAKFRDFGNFELITDNMPPVISSPNLRDNANLSRASQIVLYIRDNNETIKNFRAELDGKWIRFTNDKENAFIYKFDERCSTGNHELKITAEDEAGNISEKTYHFTR